MILDRDSRERERDEFGHFKNALDQRQCYFDGADISHLRKDAWHCGERVHPRAWHERKRLEAAKARLLNRPRCMICDNPLDPKRKGVTCSRPCAVKRWNWFGRGATRAA